MITFGTIHTVQLPTKSETSITLRTKNSNVSLIAKWSKSSDHIYIVLLETHLTDNEVERIRKTQEEDYRKSLHTSARYEARDRIATRKVERQVIQFKANQAMGDADCDEAGDLSLQDPELFNALVMKRSVDFKDPNMTKKPNTQLWNSIQNIPKEKLQMYVRPKILVRDKQACEHIVKKLQEEEVTEAIQKQWYVQERQETRARLMRQKEKNISAEAKAGVLK